MTRINKIIEVELDFKGIVTNITEVESTRTNHGSGLCIAVINATYMVWKRRCRH